MVYVDDYKGCFRGMVMSHMFADTEAELDAMAKILGLKPSWKQITNGRPPHYDVSASKRMEAIRHGAKAVTCFDMVRIVKRIQGEPTKS